MNLVVGATIENIHRIELRIVGTASRSTADTVVQQCLDRLLTETSTEPDENQN